MKPVVMITLLSSMASAMSAPVTFDADAVGKSPAGWTCGATGRGAPKWTVESDAGRKVLRQSGNAAFPWCVKDDIKLTDGWVEVRFRPLAGREDQAGGLVWRWADGENYYVARANALENNVSLYHTTNGSRRTIEYRDAPVAKDVWHTLRVDFKGEAIRVSLDGKTYIDIKDSHIRSGGKAGVWTKADSVTLFDGFAYGAHPRGGFGCW